jgi:hypothetical protein
MLISKPDDNERSRAVPRSVPRSGHGAASVIPHINQERPHPRPQGEDDHFSVETGRTVPTPPAGGDRQPER